MQKSYARIEEGMVVDKVVSNTAPSSDWVELPIELAFCSSSISFDGMNFLVIGDNFKTTEERLAIMEAENTKLKAELEVTQAVVDELLFGGVTE